MNDSSKVWLPEGLPLSVAQALSVTDAGTPMTPGLYRELLTAKLAEMIRADPKSARRAMEMSQEQAPGLWAIAEQNPVNDWASAIVQSDQVQALLSQMTWKGKLVNPTPQSLLEILELLA